jgi:hypothetical protein
VGEGIGQRHRVGPPEHHVEEIRIQRSRELRHDGQPAERTRPTIPCGEHGLDGARLRGRPEHDGEDLRAVLATGARDRSGEGRAHSAALE